MPTTRKGPAVLHTLNALAHLFLVACGIAATGQGHGAEVVLGAVGIAVLSFAVHGSYRRLVLASSASPNSPPPSGHPIVPLFRGSQHDPDAAGKPRPRAPGLSAAALA